MHGGNILQTYYAFYFLHSLLYKQYKHVSLSQRKMDHILGQHIIIIKIV